MVDGTSYPAVVSADGKYFTTSFGDGIVLAKGLAKDITVQGDIIGGPARNVIFDIEKATDVYMTGETYGYGVTPPAGSVSASDASASTQVLTTGTPWYDGITVTINAGSVSSVYNSSAVPAQNIAVNDPNTPLGGYTVNIVGEPITVGSSVFHVASTSVSNSITNVTIFDGNGNAIAGPVDIVGDGTNVGTLTFSDSITYPTGVSNFVLKGTLSPSTGGWITGNTVQASTTPSSDWTSVTGDVTGNTISLSAVGLVTMSSMNVRTAALTVSVSTLPPAQTIVGGGVIEFARYIFDSTQSGEDIRVANIPLFYYTNGTRNDLSNCQLFDGTMSVTTGSNVLNPSSSDTASSTSFTFDGGGLVIPKQSSKTLAVKCNVKSGTESLYRWGLDSAEATTYTGATGVGSGTTVVESLTYANGNVMTGTAKGSYTVTNDTSVLYGVAQAGTSGVTLGAFRFEAGSSEDVILKQIALELGNTASNSPADLMAQKVTLWNGGTQVGTAQFGSGATPDFATSTLSTPVTVTKSESVTITVKGDLSPQNAVEGTPGAFVQVNYDGSNNGLNGNYATGASSNATVSGGTTSDVTTNGVRVFRTVPTIAVVSTGGAGLAAGTDLYKVKITAGSGRDVLMSALTFDVGSNGIGFASGVKLYGPSGAVNATAVATSTDEDLTNDRLRVIFDDTNVDRLIPAGTSKTFGFRLESLTGLTTANQESITIALVSDTGYPSLSTLMGTVAGIEGSASTTDRLIWSPNSTTTPEATLAKNSNLDWTNSYGLPGFPGLGQNFSTQSFTD